MGGVLLPGDVGTLKRTGSYALGFCTRYPTAVIDRVHYYVLHLRLVLYPCERSLNVWIRLACLAVLTLAVRSCERIWEMCHERPLVINQGIRDPYV